MLDMLNIRKIVVAIGLCGILFQARAEVLVILPDSGPMARASNSIKLGIQTAYDRRGSTVALKYVDTAERPLKQVLKMHVGPQTQLIIGPLARQDVESLIQENPKLPVLALNEVSSQHSKVWQFSLSKEDDAEQLVKQMHLDGLAKLHIVREPGTESSSLTFANAVFKRFNGPVMLDTTLPKLGKHEGVLLLGTSDWVKYLNKPSKYVYVQAASIENLAQLSKGLKFCDVAVLNQPQLLPPKHVDDEPMSLAFQRLYAFGVDTWLVAEQLLQRPAKSQLDFQGYSGQLSLHQQRVARKPNCYTQSHTKLKTL